MAAYKEEDFFIADGSGSRHEIFPGIVIRSTSGKAMMLCVVNLEPDSVVLDHSHPHEQMGILISGRLQFTIGGITKVLGPGDKWRIPGGVVHSVRALDQAAVALDVFHPIREDYL
jgi:quercetin dioxygenase-like cupin family protein